MCIADRYVLPKAVTVAKSIDLRVVNTSYQTNPSTLRLIIYTCPFRIIKVRVTVLCLRELHKLYQED